MAGYVSYIRRLYAFGLHWATRCFVGALSYHVRRCVVDQRFVPRENGRWQAVLVRDSLCACSDAGIAVRRIALPQRVWIISLYQSTIQENERFPLVKKPRAPSAPHNGLGLWALFHPYSRWHTGKGLTHMCKIVDCKLQVN